MTELADKIEAAERPNREMDVRIALAVGWDLPRGGVHPFKELAEKFGFTWAVEAASDYGSVYRSLPHYTASLDAAMTLVPEGWTAEIWRYPNGRGNAILSEWSPPCRRAKVIDAATPAHALCAAALRAGGTDE